MTNKRTKTFTSSPSNKAVRPEDLRIVTETSKNPEKEYIQALSTLCANTVSKLQQMSKTNFNTQQTQQLNILIKEIPSTFNSILENKISLSKGIGNIIKDLKLFKNNIRFISTNTVISQIIKELSEFLNKTTQPKLEINVTDKDHEKNLFDKIFEDFELFRKIMYSSIKVEIENLSLELKETIKDDDFISVQDYKTIKNLEKYIEEYIKAIFDEISKSKDKYSLDLLLKELKLHFLGLCSASIKNCFEAKTQKLQTILQVFIGKITEKLLSLDLETIESKIDIKEKAPKDLSTLLLSLEEKHELISQRELHFSTITQEISTNFHEKEHTLILSKISKIDFLNIYNQFRKTKESTELELKMLEIADFLNDELHAGLNYRTNKDIYYFLCENFEIEALNLESPETISDYELPQEPSVETAIEALNLENPETISDSELQQEPRFEIARESKIIETIINSILEHLKKYENSREIQKEIFTTIFKLINKKELEKETQNIEKKELIKKLILNHIISNIYRIILKYHPLLVFNICDEIKKLNQFSIKQYESVLNFFNELMNFTCEEAVMMRIVLEQKLNKEEEEQKDFFSTKKIMEKLPAELEEYRENIEKQLEKFFYIDILSTLIAHLENISHSSSKTEKKTTSNPSEPIGLEIIHELILVKEELLQESSLEVHLLQDLKSKITKSQKDLILKLMVTSLETTSQDINEHEEMAIYEAVLTHEKIDFSNPEASIPEKLIPSIRHRAINKVFSLQLKDNELINKKIQEHFQTILQEKQKQCNIIKSQIKIAIHNFFKNAKTKKLDETLSIEIIKNENDFFETLRKAKSQIETLTKIEKEIIAEIDSIYFPDTRSAKKYIEKILLLTIKEKASRKRHLKGKKKKNGESQTTNGNSVNFYETNKESFDKILEEIELENLPLEIPEIKPTNCKNLLNDYFSSKSTLDKKTIFNFLINDNSLSLNQNFQEQYQKLITVQFNEIQVFTFEEFVLFMNEYKEENKSKEVQESDTTILIKEENNELKELSEYKEKSLKIFINKIITSVANKLIIAYLEQRTENPKKHYENTDIIEKTSKFLAIIEKHIYEYLSVEIDEFSTKESLEKEIHEKSKKISDYLTETTAKDLSKVGINIFPSSAFRNMQEIIFSINLSEKIEIETIETIIKSELFKNYKPSLKINEDETRTIKHCISDAQELSEDEILDIVVSLNEIEHFGLEIRTVEEVKELLESLIIVEKIEQTEQKEEPTPTNAETETSENSNDVIPQQQSLAPTQNVSFLTMLNDLHSKVSTLPVEFRARTEKIIEFFKGIPESERLYKWRKICLGAIFVLNNYSNKISNKQTEFLLSLLEVFQKNITILVDSKDKKTLNLELITSFSFVSIIKNLLQKESTETEATSNKEYWLERIRSSYSQFLNNNPLIKDDILASIDRKIKQGTKTKYRDQEIGLSILKTIYDEYENLNYYDEKSLIFLYRGITTILEKIDPKSEIEQIQNWLLNMPSETKTEDAPKASIRRKAQEETDALIDSDSKEIIGKIRSKLITIDQKIIELRNQISSFEDLSEKSETLTIKLDSLNQQLTELKDKQTINENQTELSQDDLAKIQEFIAMNHELKMDNLEDSMIKEKIQKLKSSEQEIISEINAEKEKNSTINYLLEIETFQNSISKLQDLTMDVLKTTELINALSKIIDSKKAKEEKENIKMKEEEIQELSQELSRLNGQILQQNQVKADLAKVQSIKNNIIQQINSTLEIN